MFTSSHRISFDQTDPGGILFYAEIFRIAHIVYEKFLGSLNLSENYFIDSKYILPIIHTEADYISPLRFGDMVDCKLNVGSLRNSSFQLNYNIFLKDKLCAKVITVHVLVLKSNFEKVPLTDDFRLQLNLHQI